jgi:hypothetical protein
LSATRLDVDLTVATVLRSFKTTGRLV